MPVEGGRFFGRLRLRAGPLLALAAIAAATIALLPSPAQAASCTATDGPSLTTDLADVNCTAIFLDPGTYTSSSGFTASRALVISGPGANSANITRTGAGAVFTLAAPVTTAITFSGVTVNGASDGSGLSVTGAGTTNVSNVVVSGNTSSGNGAGIAFSGGTLNVINSIVTGNIGSGNGAGFENASATGTANFSQVLFNLNNSDGSGGGGAFDTATIGAATNFENVTFDSNVASGDGGAIRSAAAGLATTTLNNVTIARNGADNDDSGAGDGGGISNSGGTVKVSNSIIANNTDVGDEAPDCSSAVASPVTRLGYELIQDASGCTFGGTDDTTDGYLTGMDPLLGLPAANGGTLAGGPPLLTMALQVGSPAVNAGNPDPPTGSNGKCEVIDQRSRPRTSVLVQPCDLGAYEAQPAICHNIFRTISPGQVTPVTLDCSGDPFVYFIASFPTHGSLSGFDSSTGAVTYTPDSGFTGTDSFTYQGVNGPLSSSPASVTFSVVAPAQPNPPAPQTAPPPFNLKAAIRKCKRRTPKGPKRKKCIKKAKKRARNS